MNRYLQTLKKVIFSKSYFAGAAFFIMSIFSIGYADNLSNYQMIVEAYESNNPCINKIEGNKIVINPERVSLTEEGIFLEVAPSVLLELSHLFHDTEGVYVLSQDYYYCSNCRIKYLNPGTCRQCGRRLTRYRGV